jgi:hypothetical protein
LDFAFHRAFHNIRADNFRLLFHNRNWYLSCRSEGGMNLKRKEPLPAILNAADLSNPALTNPAVARCCRIWQSVFRAELDRGEHQVLAARSAGEAYCGAMPSLTGDQNIRDFIACVAHGILLQAIEEKNGGKLLYAAQVAYASQGSRLQNRKSQEECHTLPPIEKSM